MWCWCHVTECQLIICTPQNLWNLSHLEYFGVNLKKLIIITDDVRSTREGNVFSRMRDSVYGGSLSHDALGQAERTSPSDGKDYSGRGPQDLDSPTPPPHHQEEESGSEAWSVCLHWKPERLSCTTKSVKKSLMRPSLKVFSFSMRSEPQNYVPRETKVPPLSMLVPLLLAAYGKPPYKNDFLQASVSFRRSTRTVYLIP